jgi:hypothetical protein
MARELPWKRNRNRGVDMTGGHIRFSLIWPALGTPAATWLLA